MCGIVGFINCGSEQELQKAIHVMKHRGPDNNAKVWFQERNSGLGHARLSIIDLSDTANQPMLDEQNGNWIVFNGEVYNYTEIKQELEVLGEKFKTNSDTEVVLKAFSIWGKTCLNRFNGMFAFCIYNPIKNSVFLCRDRQGIKPLYFYKTHNSLAFASEIKSLLELNCYTKEPDWRSIQTQAHFQISPFTGFKNIQKLPAGCLMEFSPETGVRIESYWRINNKEIEIDEEEAISHLDNLLNDAIKLNMVADAPIGVMLSGGLDSSILSAMMQKRSSGALNSFTIKFSKEDLKKQGNIDDSYYAKILADKFGFNHEEITITSNISDLLPKITYHLDEPIADPAAINTFLISQRAAQKGIKVLLTGMGADEVFGGYRSYNACLMAEKYQRVTPKFIQNALSSAVALFPENNKKRNFKYIRWLKRFMEVSSLNPFERQLLIKNSALQRNDFRDYYVNPVEFEKTYFYDYQQKLFNETNGSYLSKMCALDSTYYMVDHNLTYCDKSMMAAGVEGRPTLIDYRIVEYLFTLPPQFRIKGNVQKYLLKKVAEKYLPNEIVYRPKAPFSAPMRGWLKNELKEIVNDLLSEEVVKKRGVYNHIYVNKLIEENAKGIKDNSQLIWRLMVNELWFRTFFSN